MIAETIARLNAAPGYFKYVAGLAEFASLGKDQVPPQMPAAYVIPIEEEAGPNTLLNAVRQKVDASIGVVLVVQARQDAKGGQATIDLATARAQVRDRLLGWELSEAHGPFLFAGGELLRAVAGVVWWQDGYVADFSVSKV